MLQVKKLSVLVQLLKHVFLGSVASYVQVSREETQTFCMPYWRILSINSRFLGNRDKQRFV